MSDVGKQHLREVHSTINEVGPKTTDVAKREAEEARSLQGAVPESKKPARREVSFRSSSVELYSSGTDLLPQPKDEENSFHSSIRVVLHALGKEVPETIVQRIDPDYRSPSLRLHATTLQVYGTETLKKYLKPVEAPVGTSGQNRSLSTKLREQAKKLLTPREASGPFKTTYVFDTESSKKQLREALDKGPVIYDLRKTQSNPSSCHITVLAYEGNKITYADKGKLYRIADDQFFKNDYQQYGDKVMLEAKQEFPTWKAYQAKLREGTDRARPISQRSDKGEGTSKPTKLETIEEQGESDLDE